MITLEEQLKQTRHKLQELQEEYQQFAYVVSHDFNAPFRQIEELTKLVVKHHANEFDEKTNKHFYLIAKGTQKCQALLDTLLKFSRVNTRAQAFETVDCNEVVTDVQKKLTATIYECDANIICEELPAIYGDRHQIFQLFYQILKNALIYREPETRPQIAITVAPENHSWQFCVKDNGIGIGEKMIPRAFTILSRAVHDSEYPGEGAGLAIAKKIVQRHHGEIWIHSTEGFGTKVYFRIPNT